jgi:serine/threonine-protein kinase
VTDSNSSPLASASATLEPADRLVQLWEQGRRVDLDSFLETTGPLSTAELSAVLYVDQHWRWRQGERIGAESYLLRYPEIGSDADAAVDVIFHEYLLREQCGESPDAQEYSARFPEHADALASQIAFHRLLGESDRSRARPTSVTSTASLPALAPLTTDAIAADQIRLAPRGGVSTGREIQLLLRKRLRLLAVISCIAFLFYVPVLWTLFTISWGTALYVAVATEMALVALLLSSRLPLSLRALRWIEVGLFSGLLIDFGYQQVQFFQVGFFSALALDSWIGPVIAARSISWPWAVTIISYGILVPNTARRCGIAVAGMAAGFLAITLGLALSTAGVPSSARFGFVLCSMTDMALAAAVAVFGAYRIATLHQAAAKTRQLGPYRLIKRLGAGGMGEVYLAQHALLRRPCAVKLIRPEQVGDTRFLSRFEREVQAMAALSHPNTARVYDYGLAADGAFYYAMEYLPGMSLQELVARHGPLPPDRAVYLLRQVCAALCEAHAMGLVHRDIKPANILASQTGGMYDVAKLLDFGLVRSQAPNSEGQSLTALGAIAGTPAFMSPEQAAGNVEIDARSDIYSLGAVAYFLLTGRPPFMHATSVETMAAHLSEQVVPPDALQPELPAEVVRIVVRCLAKDPMQRYPDVATVESALAGCSRHGAWSSARAADWWKSIGEQSN